MGCPVTSTAANLSIKRHGPQFFQATEKRWPGQATATLWIETFPG